MKDMLLNVAPGSQPLYLRIADALRTAILRERLLPAAALPSSRQLAVRLGVHKHTVMAAMEELVAEGWLESFPRSGYRVHRNPPQHVKVQRKPMPTLESARAEFAWSQLSKPEIFSGAEYFLAQNQTQHYRFSNDGPDLRLLPLDEFRDVLRRATAACNLQIFGSLDSAGNPALLDAIETYLQRMRAIQGRRIIVTNGTTEGIMMITLMLLGHGKRVVMAPLCFPPIAQQFALTQTEIVTVRADANGIEPDALDAALCQRGANLIYLTPLHNYPTTRTMPIERRKAIYRIAAHHGVPILEDDYDHEFHYSGTPPAPMASDDPLGLVIYASTFSKSCFPGVRIGYLAVSEAIFQSLCKIRRCTSWQANGLAQQALAIWMEDGGLERHIAKCRQTYSQRLTHLVTAIEALKSSTVPELRLRPPEGGLAVWLDTGRDSHDVARRAAALGVSTHSEQFCSVSPGSRGSHIRLAFASMAECEINEGMSLVERALIDTPLLDVRTYDAVAEPLRDPLEARRIESRPMA